MKNLNKQYKWLFGLLFCSLLFLVAAIIQQNTTKSESRNAIVVERVENNLKKSFSQINDFYTRLKEDHSIKETIFDLDQSINYYIINNGKVTYYNSTLFNLNPKVVLSEGEPTLYPTSNQFSVLLKKTLNEKEILIAQIPLVHQTEINNKFLKDYTNRNIFQDFEVLIKANEQVDNQVYLNGKYLFSIDVLAASKYSLNNNIVLIAILFFLSLLFFIAYAFCFTQMLNKQRSWGWYGLAFIGTLLSYRLILLKNNLLWNSILPDFFGSDYYAASELNPSFGDLILNVLFFYLLTRYLFYHYFNTIHVEIKGKSSQIYRWLIMTIIYLLGLSFSFLFVKTCLSLQFNAQWNLDVSRYLNITETNVLISLVLFVFLCLSLFYLMHILMLYIDKLCGDHKFLFLYSLLVANIVYGCIAIFYERLYLQIMLVFDVFIIIIYWWRLFETIRKLTYKTFLYFLINAAFCSILFTLSVKSFYQNSLDSSLSNLSNYFLEEGDFIVEKLLDETREKIEKDAYIKFSMSNMFTDKEAVRQKILRKHLSSYFDKYHVKIYLFDQSGLPIENGFVSDYYSLRNTYNRKQNKTSVKQVFFKKAKTASESDTYFLFFGLFSEQYKADVGHIVIEVKLKKNLDDNVFPLLLVERDYQSTIDDFDLSYSIIRDDFLIQKYGKHTQEKIHREILENKNSNINRYKYFERDNQLMKFFEIENGKSVLFSTAVYSIRQEFSNFSFYFLFLTFSIIIWAISFTIFNSISWRHINLATKFQVYINLAFFIPLVAVSSLILSILTTNISIDINAQYKEKCNQIVSSIEPILRDENSINESTVNSIAQILAYFKEDYSLFNMDGSFISSSQPVLYEANIIPELISPKALKRIRKGEDLFILNEQIGALSFRTIYKVIRKETDEKGIGVLSIPFFNAKNRIEEQIIQLFTNILNTFSIIFLLFLCLSYIGSKSLTEPLASLAKNIHSISLTGKNKEMDYKNKDEIGVLVQEYNSMIHKLDESRIALERNQKEMAWREMARQVAHEIKNPLTPMKLSIQHLVRKITLEDKADNSNEKDAQLKALNNLLKQVDTLRDIADSFSSFARMPIPERLKFDLSQCFDGVMLLHQASLVGAIEINKNDPGSIDVIGDENLITRVISNLIINAKQSKADDRPLSIIASIEKLNKSARIIIEDNGIGIPLDIKDKVFVPNFTTKEEGSGIGLAIARRGIEHMGGRIWFESTENKGTTFFIELPLAV